MEEMNQIAEAQEKLGKDMIRMLSNMKKDSPTIKNELYWERKNEKLESIWDEAQQNHAEVRKLNLPQHSYNTTEFFEQVKRAYKEAKGYIDESRRKQASNEARPQKSQDEAVGKQENEFKVRNFHLRNGLRQIEMELREGKQGNRFEVIKNRITRQWEAIEKLNMELEAQGLESVGEYEEVQEWYEQILEQLATVNKTEKIEQENTGKNLSLPQIQLPIFEGKYEAWPTFFDMFIKIIHENKALTDIEKMQFLKSQVRGEASKAIQHFHITESNYQAALDILEKRYSNRRLLLAKLLDKILDFPTITHPSVEKIKQLHDTTVECLMAIDNMGVNTTEWGPIIIRIITRKWDAETNKLYEQSLNNPLEVQELQQVISWLQTRFQSMEAMSLSKSSTGNHFEFKRNQSCACCHQAHPLHMCLKFKAMSTYNRLQFVKEKRLCINCMSIHQQWRCPSTNRCKICQGIHHTMVHTDQGAKPNFRIQHYTDHPSRGYPNNRPRASAQRVERPATHMSRANITTLLATALIKVKTTSNSTTFLRALIDPGSQATLITEEATNRIGLPRRRHEAEISGLNTTEPKKSHWKVTLQLQARFPSKFILQTEAMVLKNLTRKLPENELESSQEKWENRLLADPYYYIPSAIDIILGVKEFGEIIKEGIMKTKDGMLGQNTEFGWIVSGELSKAMEQKKTIVSMTLCVEEAEQLSKFWELEEASAEKYVDEDEIKCEEHFNTNTRRNSNGSYMVKIPFKAKPEDMGNSKARAAARLQQVERRFKRDKALEKEYKKFMEEYIQLGHMEAIPKDMEGKGKYYIPHQPVVNEGSSTTKLRVVFDASSKTTSGISLNELMHSGPRLQQDLVDILIRWRKHHIVFTADIEKMYRQIQIHPEDQDFQRIVWRFNENTPMQEYALKTVTYGTTAAPYLAVRTLQQLAQDERENWPVATEITLRDFYVDDLVSGADSIEEAKIAQKEIDTMMQAGNFTLRKWASNQPEIMENIPQEKRNQEAHEFKADETIKSLGIHWAPQNDSFTFKVKNQKKHQVTKRTILSETAKVYDPLGWLAPITIKAKLIIQQLWEMELQWDKTPPEKITNQWITFRDQLQAIEEIKIPRWINYRKAETIELHGFCDSSEKAYGAVIYTKTIATNGESKVTLLVAKSKVAPIKTKQTIPRLELCAAVLLAKLMNRVVTALQIENVKTYAWSDSMITISWIQAGPSRWKTFVANRVAEINRLLPSQKWFYIKTGDNPADIISRGIDPGQLKNLKIWWSGPQVLKQEMKMEPQIIVETKEEEKKSVQVTVVTAKEKKWMEGLVERYSSLSKSQKIIAWCVRFLTRCQNKSQAREQLTAKELTDALQRMTKILQHGAFQREVGKLTKRTPIERNSTILALNPFLDENQILRVGGRLHNSKLPYEEKHPIILSREMHITKLLIEEAHSRTLHGGPQTTLAYIRRKYWIIKGRAAVKEVINKCVTCIRYKAQNAQQLMGNLPEVRVSPAPPFFNTGIDYAGPFQIRATKGRGYKAYKGYIAVFVCLTTKAIHLEVVGDMTTDTFIAALERFIARRGRCANIYSDNGTTFVGTRNKLLPEIQSIITHPSTQNTATNRGIQWHFIPPMAPHFGGIWEAAVKSMKHHLKRIIGESTLTYEELNTLIQKIEACLNSRPLCALTNNPEEGLALTAGHFLIGRALIAPQETDIMDIQVSLTERWRLIQKMKADFWKTWATEYLSTLQQRYKWKEASPNMEIGDIVIVKEELKNPGQWPLARIKEVHPGKDGVVRVATIQQAGSKEVKRPIHKLIPLPKEKENKKKSTAINYKRCWRIVIMAIIFLATIGKTTAEKFTIHDLPPGIYIEQLGQAKIDRGIFRIELKYEKSQIQSDGMEVRKVITEMEKLCSEAIALPTTVQCQPLVEHLRQKEIQLNWIKKGMEGVTRSKRGALGKLFTAIFGVNDEVYQDIDTLNRNQLELITTVKHQSRIMVQTLAEFNDTEVRIEKQLNRFRDKLNEGLAAINEMSKWYNKIHENELEIYILHTYQIAQNYIEEIMEQHGKLLDLHYNRGHFYELITPAHIEEIITEASQKLPNNIKILQHPIQKTSVNQSTEYIHIYGYFAMTDITTYKLIKATPTPLKLEEEAFWILDIPNDILAIDYDNQQYFQLDRNDIKSSIKLENSTYICAANVIKNMETNPNCVVDEIFQRAEGEQCPVLKHTFKSTIWKQLDTPNHWMFISPKILKAAIICNGEREDITLNQTGIIAINTNCYLQTKWTRILPKQETEVTVLASFIKPVSVNISAIHLNHKPYLEEEPVIKAVDNFGIIMEKEQQTQTKLEETQWHSIQKYTWTTNSIMMGGSLVLITITFLGWYQYRRCKQPNTSNTNQSTEEEGVELQPLYAMVDHSNSKSSQAAN